jgi:hypothetical protein
MQRIQCSLLFIITCFFISGDILVCVSCLFFCFYSTQFQERERERESKFCLKNKRIMRFLIRVLIHHYKPKFLSQSRISHSIRIKAADSQWYVELLQILSETKIQEMARYYSQNPKLPSWACPFRDPFE